MNNRHLAHLALLAALAAAAFQTASLAQDKPGAPVLNSKATLPPGDLATAATATGHAQLVALLRNASDEMQNQKEGSAEASDWTDIARDQGIIKDLEGLKITAARIQKTIDAITDPDDKKDATAESWPALAGAFAWAGDMDTAKTYAARVAKDAEPETVGRMHAQMGDIPGVDLALAPMEKDDREFAYGSIAEDIWIGDPVMAQKLLDKLKNPDGSPQKFIAVHYADAGQIDKALPIAKTADEPYYWQSIAEAYIERQDFKSAATAKAAYLKSVAGQDEAEKKKDLFVTFDYQTELDKPDVVAATVGKLAKYALAMMEVSDKKWHVAAGEAAYAAAEIGDDATVATIVDAVSKMPNDNHEHEYVADAASSGHAEKLLADGKADAAISLADSVTREHGWTTWKTKNDLYLHAMEKGDIPLALKIEAGTGTVHMLNWVMTQLIKMQRDGTPLEGKPVDIFAFIAAKKDPYDRGIASIAVAEDLLRLGAPRE